MLTNLYENYSFYFSKKQGLKGLILDLRGNPGGLLESAVDVSALLVPQGSDIVSAKGRAFGEVSHTKYTNTTQILHKYYTNTVYIAQTTCIVTGCMHAM
jgi:C-terminal processing protease CtpA/Prc